MLIVSQDKEERINFDNIININAILNDSIIEENNGYDIWVGTTQCVEDNYRRIGTYATKERAQEILKEIIAKYRKYNLDNNKAVTLIPKVYEMPKE